MSERRVVVTGAGGFVGVNIVRGLAERGWRVTATARRTPDALIDAYLASVAPNVEWRLGDSTSERWLESVTRDVRPHGFVHAAAITPTSSVERDATRSVIDTNLTATVGVLEIVRSLRVPRLVFASSTGVYVGSSTGAPRSEDEAVRGHNLYSVCKIASEALLRTYVRVHGLSACSVRIGSVYGPMERPSGSRTGLSVVARLLPWALARGHLRVAGAAVRRDLIHASDVAGALDAILRVPRLEHDVLNLGSAVAYPIGDVLGTLGSVSGATWSLAPEDEADEAWGPADHRDGLDQHRLTDGVGWTHRVELYAGLHDTLRWHALGDDLDAIAAYQGGTG